MPGYDVLAYNKFTNNEGENCVELFDREKRFDICCILEQPMAVNPGEWYSLAVEPDADGIVRVFMDDLRQLDPSEHHLPYAYLDQEENQVNVQVNMMFSPDNRHESHNRCVAYSLEFGRIYSNDDFNTIPEGFIHKLNVIRATPTIKKKFDVKWMINEKSPQIKEANQQFQEEYCERFMKEMEESANRHPPGFMNNMNERGNFREERPRRRLKANRENRRRNREQEEKDPTLPSYSFSNARTGFSSSNAFNESSFNRQGNFGKNNVPKNWYGAASQGKSLPRIASREGVQALIDWTSLKHEEIVAKLRENLALIVTEQYSEGSAKYAYAFHRLPRFALLTTFYEEALDVLCPTSINVGDWFQGLCSHAKKSNRRNQKTNGILVDKVIRKIPHPFPTSVENGKVRCIIALEVPSEYNPQVTDWMTVDRRLKDFVAVEHNMLGHVGMPYNDFMNWRNKRVRCIVEALSFSDLPLQIAKQTITGFQVIEIEKQMASGEVIENQIDTPSGQLPRPTSVVDGMVSCGLPSLSFPINHEASRSGPNSSDEEEEEELDDEDDEEDDNLYGEGVSGSGRVRQEGNDASESPPSYNEQISNNEAANWNPERPSSPISQHSGRSQHYAPMSYQELVQLNNPPRQESPEPSRFSPPRSHSDSQMSDSQYSQQHSQPSVYSFSKPDQSRQAPPPGFSPPSCPQLSQPSAFGRSQSSVSPSINQGLQKHQQLLYQPDPGCESLQTEGVVIGRSASNLMFIYANDVGVTLVSNEVQWLTNVGHWYSFKAQKLLIPLPGCEYVTVDKLANSDDLMPTRSLEMIVELQTCITIDHRAQPRSDGFFVAESGDVGAVLINETVTEFEDGGSLTLQEIKRFDRLEVVIRPWLKRPGKLEWICSLIRPTFVIPETEIRPLIKLDLIDRFPTDNNQQFNMLLNDLNEFCADFGKSQLHQPTPQPQYQQASTPQTGYPASSRSTPYSNYSGTRPTSTATVPRIVHDASDLLARLWNIEGIRLEAESRNHNLYEEIKDYIRHTQNPSTYSSRPSTTFRDEPPASRPSATYRNEPPSINHYTASSSQMSFNDPSSSNYNNSSTSDYYFSTNGAYDRSSFNYSSNTNYTNPQRGGQTSSYDRSNYSNDTHNAPSNYNAQPKNYSNDFNNAAPSNSYAPASFNDRQRSNRRDVYGTDKYDSNGSSNQNDRRGRGRGFDGNKTNRKEK
ncbi:unnamed protein product, partial [Mesorhabditis belari]|uniref:Uncharacterized protein n=1 Tax=Mesorhabditis belari TaxID=2138241 RepID=A0AAF3FK00_9BILA